jgi:hypothetical protein
MEINKPFKAWLHCLYWKWQLSGKCPVTPAGNDKIIWSIAWAIDDGFERHFTRIHHLQIQKAKCQTVQTEQKIIFYKVHFEVASTTFTTSCFSWNDKDLCLMKVSCVVAMLITCSINNSSTGWKLLTQAQCDVDTKCTVYKFWRQNT